MVVSASYEQAAGKQFHIVSQQESKFIQDKVFKRLLASEQEATERGNREETALTPRNYDFTLLGEEDIDGAHRYVVAVSPRTKNKFLYRGTIWIDAKDYAVARTEAEPARNPSFWTSKSRVLHATARWATFGCLPKTAPPATSAWGAGHAHHPVRRLRIDGRIAANNARARSPSCFGG